MSSVNENPVHAAVKALEHAMRATHEHHRQVSEHAAAARPVPPAAPVNRDATVIPAGVAK